MALSEVADNWEDLLSSESETEKKAKANKQNERVPPKKPSAAAPGKKKAQKGRSNKRGNKSDDQEDYIAEKLRTQRLVEEADAVITHDLFDGCDRPDDEYDGKGAQKTVKNEDCVIEEVDLMNKDPFASFNLASIKDVELLASKLCERFARTEAKSVALVRFVDVTLRDASPKMESKDLTTLANKIISLNQNRRNLMVKGNKSATSDTGNSANSFDKVPLNSLKEIETFGETMAAIIRDNPAKSASWLRFFDLILASIGPRIDSKELNALLSKVRNCIQQKLLTQRESTDHKRKPNDAGSLLKSYKDEVDMFYGDLSQDEESYDEDDLSCYMKH